MMTCTRTIRSDADLYDVNSSSAVRVYIVILWLGFSGTLLFNTRRYHVRFGDSNEACFTFGWNIRRAVSRTSMLVDKYC